MHLRSLSRGILVVSGALLALWAGCSEEDPIEVDQTPPVVSFVQPDLGTGLKISPTAIEDSIVIIVQATDPSGIERVEFWCTFHADTISTLLGQDETADEGSQYTLRWDTRVYTNGTTGVLWARAIDKLGNEGRTPQGVTIRTINSTDKQPPDADFTISPSSGGTVANAFRFDPSTTTDQIDELNKIRVRWDFDYDASTGPTWDIDTTDARADEIKEHRYAQPATYEIAMQAFNSYYPQGSALATRELTVRPEFGEPNDPAPTVLIPMGTYPIGVGRVAGGNASKYSENELVDTELFVTITANVLIDKYEVTNHHYVNFLNLVADSAKIEVDLASGEVTDVATGQILIVLDSQITRILYIDEETGFTIDAAARNLPVTGVTWFGAKSYCSTYGLRLPTEYEWEIAARLGRITTTAEAGYIYPWSPDTQISGTYANFRDSGDPYEERNNLRAEGPVGAYSDIDSLSGSFPHENAEGPLGTYDQAGNVAEWVNDWYVPGIYTTLRARSVQTGRWPSDPQSPKESESLTRTRVVRGGSFFDSPSLLRVTRREARDPEIGVATVGFRACYTEFNP